MYTKACLILAGLLSTAQAAPLERNNITSCAYQAGTAYEI